MGKNVTWWKTKETNTCMGTQSLYLSEVKSDWDICSAFLPIGIGRALKITPHPRYIAKSVVLGEIKEQQSSLPNVAGTSGVYSYILIYDTCYWRFQTETHVVLLANYTKKDAHRTGILVMPPYVTFVQIHFENIWLQISILSTWSGVILIIIISTICFDNKQRIEWKSCDLSLEV